MTLPRPLPSTPAETPTGRPSWPLELDPEEIRRRFSWARRRGHPHYPWPEIPVTEWRAALREIERATGAVLAGERATLPEREQTGARALGVAAFTSGMGPLLGAWAEAGALTVRGEAGAVLETHLAHGRARAGRFRAELERAREALAAEGIRPLLLKGAHTAPVYFPEAGTRPLADLDLVVEEERWEDAGRALGAAGWTRVRGQRRPKRSEWRAPGSSSAPRSLELTHADNPYTLDLHASLDRDFFGVATVRLPRAVRRAPAEVGEGLDVLAQPALLLLLALHASEGLHGLTLIRLVELVLVARRDLSTGALDERAALSLMERTGAARFAWPALALAERLAPETFPKALLDSARGAATPRMTRLLEGMAPSDAQRPTGRSLGESFLWCRTPGEYLRRLAHMALPSAADGPRALARLYAERAYRLLRGRVRTRG